MIDWIYPAIMIGAGLIVVSVMTSLVAFRFGAPLLLVFLGIGLLAGEDGLGLTFDDTNAAYFIGSLALAVILFDSGFGTALKSIRKAAAPAVVLATAGVILTTLIVGGAARLIFGFSWPESLLMGAIVSSTDAAAVFFLLRVGGIHIRDNVRATLEVESGSNDPMAIFLTITLVELVLADPGMVGLTTDFLIGFGWQMGLGLVMGALGGYLIVQTINRLELEGALYPLIVLGLAVLVFAVTGALGGSGALAAYVAGLVAGNSQIRSKSTLSRFQSGMTWLAQIVMFLILGLLANPSEFVGVALPAVGLALVLMFVARPVAVWLCLLPFRYSRDEEAFISWVGLRGAVSILLAILPLIAVLPSGSTIFNTAFIIVLTSLLIQGWTIGPMARWLKLIVTPRIGPVERVDLELPGSARHELIVYHVVPGSPVVEGERLPRWARPSLVVRDGQSMRFQFAGRLRAGDYVYMFIAPRYARLLDRLFASPAKVEADDKDFFGAFVVSPDRPLSMLRDAYGAEITGNVDPETSIAKFIRDRLGGTAEIGDRVSLGQIELIVREVNIEGEVVEAGLAIDQESEKQKVPVFITGREIGQFGRDVVRRWRHRRQTRKMPLVMPESVADDARDDTSSEASVPSQAQDPHAKLDQSDASDPNLR